MASRSANATIKGYYYQFEHTIEKLLSLSNQSDIVKVEVAEDIDISSADEDTLIQCKYYEGTEYNHSLIKDPLEEMLRHFKASKGVSVRKIHYKIYGYYKSGQEKLTTPIEIDFAKTTFFTRKKGESGVQVTHDFCAELGVTDKELAEFLSVLEIDINAKNYDSQFLTIKKLLREKIAGCSEDDVENFYYPLALNVIRKLAIANKCKEI